MLTLTSHRTLSRMDQNLLIKNLVTLPAVMARGRGRGPQTAPRWQARLRPTLPCLRWEKCQYIQSGFFLSQTPFSNYIEAFIRFNKHCQKVPKGTFYLGTDRQTLGLSSSMIQPSGASNVMIAILRILFLFLFPISLHFFKRMARAKMKERTGSNKVKNLASLKCDGAYRHRTKKEKAQVLSTVYNCDVNLSIHLFTLLFFIIIKYNL